MRVSEVYASVQGEGPRTGQTTVFVRFGGCNLKCPGWPCDTQHAIDPAFRKEWQVTDASDLFQRIDCTAKLAGAKLITLTGGEPFLQNRAELEELTQSLSDAGYRIEAFTNGTLEYPGWATNSIAMIMDWKLPGSGEAYLHDQRDKNIEMLAHSPNQTHAIKFVCKDEEDFFTAFALWSGLPEGIRDRFIWYYGKVWDAKIKNADLVELVLTEHLPWRLNVQLHNYIWDPQERGR